MAVIYRISELAADLAVTTRTIRFYEEQGLISPDRRGHERIYTPHERQLLRIALTGKQLGLTLAECRELLELYQAPPETSATRERQQRLDHYRHFLATQQQALVTLSQTLYTLQERDQQHHAAELAKTTRLSSGETQPSLFATVTPTVLAPPLAAMENEPAPTVIDDRNDPAWADSSSPAKTTPADEDDSIDIHEDHGGQLTFLR